MRYTLLILFLLFTYNIAYSQSKTVKGLDQLNSESVYQITSDSHDSWVDWSNNDKSIFFISPKTGNNNIYRIHLNEITFVELKPGFFAAKYLIDSTATAPIKQITFETERIVESPVSIPNINQVAFITYLCESYECGNFDVKILDLNENEAQTILLEEESPIYFYDFIDENRLLYVSENSDSTLMEVNISTGQKTSFKSLGFPISALNVDSENILVGSPEGIYSVDIESKELKLVYDGKLLGSRISKAAQNLIGTLPGPAAGMVNIETNEQTKFVDSYDYQPSLSNNKKFVAIISEGAGGILIKKIE